MKNYAFLCIAGMLLTGCNNEEMENRIAQLEDEKTEMLAALEAKDNDIVSFMSSFSTIEENLREIREREMNISVAQQEKNMSSDKLETRITTDIEVINELLQDNRKKLERLSARLAASKTDNKKLAALMEKMKKDLTAQISEREEQVGMLKDQLASKEIEVVTLNNTLAELRKNGLMQDSVIHHHIEELNTAYYVIGTSKELEKDQVISKEGGLLGLGKTEKLSDNLNTSRFTKIDIRRELLFPIEAKHIELVSAHPESAYKIEKDEAHAQVKLVISDPKAFWSSSKYLVLMKK